MLAEFSSAVDAVRCAIEFQRGMSERNAGVAPEKKRIDFRIGINIGDVISDRGDIFGDGVNVAARLEGIADPGGVCLSDDVFRQVQGRIAGDFLDLGEQQLKNIARPVRVFCVRLNGASGEAAAGAGSRSDRSLSDLAMKCVATLNCGPAGAEAERFRAAQCSRGRLDRVGPRRLSVFAVAPLLNCRC